MFNYKLVKSLPHMLTMACVWAIASADLVKFSLAGGCLEDPTTGLRVGRDLPTPQPVSGYILREVVSLSPSWRLGTSTRLRVMVEEGNGD